MWALGRLVLEISQHEDNFRHIKASSAVELILAVQRFIGKRPTIDFAVLIREHYAFLELHRGWLRLAPHLRDLADYTDICDRIALMNSVVDVIPYSHSIPNRHLLSVVRSLLELDPTKRLTAKALLRTPYMTIIIPQSSTRHK